MCEISHSQFFSFSAQSKKVGVESLSEPESIWLRLSRGRQKAGLSRKQHIMRAHGMRGGGGGNPRGNGEAVDSSTVLSRAGPRERRQTPGEREPALEDSAVSVQRHSGLSLA